MIVTRLAGGLGNQLFQYAIGRQLALRRATSLHLDLSWFGHILPGETRRSYALEPYCLTAPVDGWDHVRHRLAAGHGAVGRIARRAGLKAGRVLVDRAAGFRPAVLDAPDGTLLIGSWQTERYFSDIAATIRSDLQLAAGTAEIDTELLELVRSKPSVSLHIRRTDFLTNPNNAKVLGVLDFDYYAAALRLVADRVEGLCVFVFSDDPAWCQENLSLGHPMTVVDQGGEDAVHQDLRLMAACRHHIVANSSFSWWGAWLDPDPEAVVVAPRRWGTQPRRLLDIHADGWLVA